MIWQDRCNSEERGTRQKRWGKRFRSVSAEIAVRGPGDPLIGPLTFFCFFGLVSSVHALSAQNFSRRGYGKYAWLVRMKK
jgi:hypothetical protein